MDHYRSPRGRHRPEHCDCSNEGQNPLCGDEVELCAALSDVKVDEVYVGTKGCSICTAAGSMMAELLPGKTLDEVAALTKIFKGMMHGEAVNGDLEIGDLDALQGVRKFPIRVKCALLPWTTLEDALKAFQEGHDHPNAATTTED